MPLLVRADKTGLVAAAIRLLVRRKVRVGIPADNDSREEGGVTNAQLGYIHEFGEPLVNIPARPHLAPGVRDATPEINARLRAAGVAALTGQGAKVAANLEAAGMAGVKGVQARIRSNIPPPTKKRTHAVAMLRGTRAIKAARKRALEIDAGSVALIDTGAYLASITYTVDR